MVKSTFGRGSRRRRGFVKAFTAIFSGWFVHRRIQAKAAGEPWEPWEDMNPLNLARWLYGLLPGRLALGGAAAPRGGPWSEGTLLVFRAAAALATIALAFALSEYSRRSPRRGPRAARRGAPPEAPAAADPVAAARRSAVEASVAAARAANAAAEAEPAGAAEPHHRERASPLPDEATLQIHLQKYHANLAKAMKLKREHLCGIPTDSRYLQREHGDLTPDQEKILTTKFDEMRETIRMTEEVLGHVRAAKRRDAKRAAAARDAAERAELACGTCAVVGGCACCVPTTGSGG